MDDREQMQFALERRKVALEFQKAKLDYRKFIWGSVFAAIAIARRCGSQAVTAQTGLDLRGGRICGAEPQHRRQSAIFNDQNDCRAISWPDAGKRYRSARSVARRGRRAQLLEVEGCDHRRVDHYD